MTEFFVTDTPARRPSLLLARPHNDAGVMRVGGKGARMGYDRLRDRFRRQPGSDAQ